MLIDNLVDNAPRYCQPGARVDNQAAFGCRQRRCWKWPTTAPGIADADKSRVLQRFVRLRPADTTGSGLGMAIVRQIAEQHQAELSLLDAPGGGLTVRIEWPRRAEKPLPSR